MCRQASLGKKNTLRGYYGNKNCNVCRHLLSVDTQLAQSTALLFSSECCFHSWDSRSKWKVVQGHPWHVLLLPWGQSFNMKIFLTNLQVKHFFSQLCHPATVSSQRWQQHVIFSQGWCLHQSDCFTCETLCALSFLKVLVPGEEVGASPASCPF